MGEFIRFESDGPVRHIVLNAPQRLNALDRPMLAELAEAVRAVAADEEARALVVSGAGRAFCAGADVTSLFGDPTRPPAVIRDELKQVYASFLSIADLTIPTIAAVGGIAVGAGVNIAMACDMVVAGPKAKFAITFAEMGLHPGGGCSWFSPADGRAPGWRPCWTRSESTLKRRSAPVWSPAGGGSGG